MPNPPPWKTSEAKAILQADILSGLVPPTMPAMVVYNSRPEFQVYPYSRFVPNLKRLRESRAPTPKLWKKSKAKEVLRNEIVSGLVGPGMDARQVYDMHSDLYHPYQFANF
jgi:hypothetical protein